EGLLVSTGPFLSIHIEQIVDFATRSRLPAVYPNRRAVDAGGLMSYTTSQSAQYRHAATYVDKILKGKRPSDLPVEQAREFEFALNLKAAQALSLTIPQSALLQATEVIQ